MGGLPAILERLPAGGLTCGPYDSTQTALVVVAGDAELLEVGKASEIVGHCREHDGAGRGIVPRVRQGEPASVRCLQSPSCGRDERCSIHLVCPIRERVEEDRSEAKRVPIA